MIIAPLPAFGVLAVSGADRVSFLQGQMTLDVAALGAADTALGAFLTPAGRALALPRLIALEAAIALLLPAELVADLRERLARYVLRAKVQFTADADLRVAAVLADSAADLDRAFGTGPASGHVRRADGTDLVRLGARGLLVGPAAAVAAALTPDSEDAGAHWERAAIAAGEPGVVAATAEAWTPQMLNLDRLGAVSFTKGCYTGQEIVARTQHLGRIKRRMFRYRAASAVSIAPGEALALAGAKVGEVVRAAAGTHDTELLAVVGLEAEGQPLESTRGVRFEPLPLPYALA